MTYSITTRTGDSGTSSLYSGERILKSDEVFDIVGDVDELNSVLGIAAVAIQNKWFKNKNIKYIEKELRSIQNFLFVTASEIATSGKKRNKLKIRISKEHVDLLDKKILDTENTITMPNGFVIPGGCEISGYIDYARTLARRVERKVTKLHKTRAWFDDSTICIWYNRLSDYLWLLGRLAEHPKKTILKK